MLHYIDGDGFEDWRNPIRLKGSFDWKELSFMTPVPALPTKENCCNDLQTLKVKAWNVNLVRV